MIKVAFLFDRNNDWIKNFFNFSSDYLSNFEVTVADDPKDLISNEIVFVLGYTKKLGKDFLKKNTMTLVIHESDLPYGKGFSPIQWQILEGKNKVTASLIEITEEIDAGDIIEQTEIFFDGTELYDEIREKQAKASIKLIKTFLENYPAYSRKSQLGESTFFRRRNPEDSKLDINKTILENFCLMRINNNEGWPSYFIHNEKKYIIKIYKEDI